jgi:hypothetical protein
MYESMRIADDHSKNDGSTSASIHELRNTLRDCLASLDALNTPIAAAYLSACLETLKQDFNLE